MTRKSKKEEATTLHSLGRKVDGVLEMLGSFAEATEKRFTGIEKRITTVFVALNDRMDGIDERLGDMGRKLGKIESTTLEIHDELVNTHKAIDIDAETVVNHEKRIARLETARQ